MSDLKKITDNYVKFRDDRDWKQFHGFKDLAIDLSVEAAEVLEHFQWKTPEEINEYLKTKKDAVADELADVLHNILLLAHDLEIDMVKASEKKLKQNEKKYPIAKARGKHTKYTDL